MPTLHIEHAIVDLDVWTAAFNRFAEARTRFGVRGHRIQRPVDDDHYLHIDLDFDSTAEAEAFRQFLTTQVWASPQNSPALAGTPRTAILEPVPA